MSPLVISLIVFAFIFAGALFGLFLYASLPEHHLKNRSKDGVKLGVGLIATLTALVLGLLVSSAKTTFDTMSDELKQAGTKVILLDHVLAHYGSETTKIRKILRQKLMTTVDMIWNEQDLGSVDSRLTQKPSGIEETHYKIQDLLPKNDRQKRLQAEALQLSAELTQARWLLIEQAQSSIPIPFLVVLVFWLFIFFTGFGLLSSHNATIVTVMCVCALSVSGAIFLILEMDRPLDGMLKVSSVPLRKALDNIGSE